jgi:hypothetical protein
VRGANRDDLRRPDYLSVAAKIRERHSAEIRTMTADTACAGFPMVRFGPDETILPDPAAIRAWYDHGNDHGPLPARREALTGLLPGIRVRAWHTRRCADACTAHRRPYIDILQPGRLTIALGGNGRGAQAADAVGQLTASLALTSHWPSDLPRRLPPHPRPQPLEWHDLALRPASRPKP